MATDTLPRESLTREVEAVMNPDQYAETIENRPGRTVGDYVWGLLRISVGWIFFWAFIDKLFGLGFATASESSWLNGGSPTSGTFSSRPRVPSPSSISRLRAAPWSTGPS